MKKLLLFLFALPLLMFSACSDDDKLPSVNVEMTLSNVSKVGDTFYAVQGDEITVDGLSVKSLTNKGATVTNVIYRLRQGNEFAWITPSMDEPFNYSFSTEDLSVGTYSLVVNATILQVDKSITQGYFGYPLQIVEQLPEGAPELGTYTVTTTIQPD